VNHLERALGCGGMEEPPTTPGVPPTEPPGEAPEPIEGDELAPPAPGLPADEDDDR
jgi:hypothetical protein